MVTVQCIEAGRYKPTALDNIIIQYNIYYLEGWGGGCWGGGGELIVDVVVRWAGLNITADLLVFSHATFSRVYSE